MQLTRIVQHKLDDLGHFDLVIAASGYEKRSTRFAKLLAESGGEKKCLAFSEQNQNKTRKENDKKYKLLGYNLINSSGQSSSTIKEILKEELDKFSQQRTLSIAVDISSMTRTWFGAVVRFLSTLNNINGQVSVTFFYVTAAFSTKESSYPSNKIAAPVRGFAGLGLPNKATALIIGLGKDDNRALGITEVIDPGRLAVFYTSPAADMRYERFVLKANESLLSIVEQDLVCRYPLHDAITSLTRLDSLVKSMLQDWQIVLTSLGPKIFSLYCFLLATRYPEVSVWRVSSGSNRKATERGAGRTMIILETIWDNR